MITQSVWVRDTLIKIDVLNALPESRKQKVEQLYEQFTGLGYIDARTEIGPAQYGRMSQKQKEKIRKTATKVFVIEQEIKQLLKSDEQLQLEAKQAAEQAKQDRIQYLRNRSTQIMRYCQKRLLSDRMNSTKRELEEIQTELDLLLK